MPRISTRALGIALAVVTIIIAVMAILGSKPARPASMPAPIHRPDMIA
jgi:hypothetical protein